MFDLHKHARVGGYAPPGNFLEIRCSEVASEAILGQKQSCSSYVVCRVLHPILASMFAFAKPPDFKFSRRVLRLVEQQERWHHWMDNLRAPELAIYLCTCLCVSFHRSSINTKQLMHARCALILHERTSIL